MFNSIPEHPIAALSTPRYKSALAIIRVTGSSCIELLDAFQKSSNLISKQEAAQTKLRKLYNPTTNKLIDEVMLTVYRAPHSYTGQDSVDISLHGGLIAIDLLLSALYAHGFEAAEPGEFSKRAYLNGKIDLTQAEAIHSIIEAHSVEEHSLAMQQLSGSISGFIDKMKTQLVEIAAICSISLDYPDDEIQESTEIDRQLILDLIKNLDASIESYKVTQKHKEGAVVILSGLTNAGKSSLFNVLLKEERSIVSDTHGTTRDYIESQLLLKSSPIRLFDTAGLRKTNQDVEQEGIERSYRLVESADILLYVIDSSLGLQEKDKEQLQLIYAKNKSLVTRSIIVWNKIDLTEHHSAPKEISLDINQEQVILDNIISTSTQDYENIHQLQEHLHLFIAKQQVTFSEDLTVINSLRQQQYLQECKDSLEHVLEGIDMGIALDMISLDVASALNALGKITGEVSNEEILDVMFSNFCVGK